MKGADAKHTPGQTWYECQACGWSGYVNGRPRCLPCYAERTRLWRRNNPEKAREYKRYWASTDQGKRYYRQKRRDQRRRNPETVHAAWKRRTEWLKTGDVTREQLEQIYRRDQGKCVYCGDEVDARFNPNDPRGFDHVIPRAKGGKHTAVNLVVSCGPCNAAKADEVVVNV